jgi:hypothetical protein
MHYPCEISSVKPPGIGCIFLHHQGAYKIVSCAYEVMTKKMLCLKINSRRETIGEMLLPLVKYCWIYLGLILTLFLEEPTVALPELRAQQSIN